MTIKEGLKLQSDGYGKVEIPECSRRDFPKFLRQIGCRVGVEIGVQRASFTRRLLAAGLKVYGVDPWESYKDYYVDEAFANRQQTIYEAALKNIEKYQDKCILIRKKSMDALSEFEDNSIDFVYIDGHHGFKYVTEDIYEWSKKVRKGGIISGHDYAYGKQRGDLHPYTLQVRWVIDAYTRAFRIKKWYVIGRKEKGSDSESRDRFRSWFWFKT